MWETRVECLEAGRVRKVAVLERAHPLCYSDVIEKWQGDKAFRGFFISVLAQAPFPAYFWETPPITATTQDQAFEFVLVDSPELAAVAPDQEAFADHFDAANAADGIVAFSNLGKDALLVVPCPRAHLSVYSHIAAFARGAPAVQQHALWRRVGAVLRQGLHQQPVWLSTAGSGVSWLHLRLDSRPKYYNFHPYRDPIHPG